MTATELNAITARAFGETKLLSPFLYKQISRRKWRLTDDLMVFDGKHVIVIPKGFIWDGASVPFFASWYCGRADFLAASCVHDWIYGYHRVLVQITTAYGTRTEWWSCTKHYADKLFAELVADIYKARKTKALTLGACVAVFGWWAWSTDVCLRQCAKGGTCKQQEGCPIKESAAAYTGHEINGDLT